MKSTSSTNFWRFLGIGLLLSSMVLIALYGRQWWPVIEQTVSQGGTKGFILFMGAFIVLTSLCFPVSVLGFTAGLLYGPWLGLLLLFPSGVLSGILIFFLGRTLLREFVQNFVQDRPKLSAIEKVAGKQAVRLNILTRLSPFNYGLASYALSVGKSSFRAYILGIMAILPSMVVQVWVGALAGKTGRLSQDELTKNPLQFGLLIIGVLFFGVLSLQVSKMVKQALGSADTSLDD